MKKGLSALTVIIAAVFLLSGCTAGSGALREHSFDQGLSVSLPGGFRQQSREGSDILMAGPDGVLFMAVRDTLESLGDRGYDTDSITLEDYFGLVQDANGITKEETEGTEAVFVRHSGQTDYTYFLTVRQGTDAFWTIWFISPANAEEDPVASFREWAGTISVD